MLKQLHHYYRALAVDLACPESKRELAEQVATVVVSLALLGSAVGMFSQLLAGYGILLGPYVLPGLGMGVIVGVIFTAITYHYGKRQARSEAVATEQETS